MHEKLMSGTHISSQQREASLMRITKLLLLVALFSLSMLVPGLAVQSPGIDSALAADYFKEAAEMGRSDNGALWGVGLYGPMIFADRRSRKVVANQPDAEGRLQKEGEVYVGTLPP